MLGWTLSKEVSGRPITLQESDEMKDPGINNNKNGLSSQTPCLCLAQCLSAFPVRPNRELYLYVFSIPDRKKRLVHPDNQGI